MKCIRCGVDSKYKERSNRTCPGCHKPFAFEPQQGDKLTDAAFQNAIERVSSDGRVRWGVEHLYYEIAREFRTKGWPFIVLTAIPGAIGLVLVFVKGYKAAAIAIAIAIFFGAIGWMRKTAKTINFDLGDFNKMWSTWQTAHGQPKGLIVRAHPRDAPPSPRKLESDIADYSFDRAVICDRARTADLLLANNFHFEYNCAVLSMDGYPEGQFDTVRAMLKRNPRLLAFALHDASPPGCRIAHRLANDTEWFAGQAKVTDVGLRPGHAEVFRGLFLRGGPRIVAGAGISASEARWLSDYTLELAVLRPEQILKRLYAALHWKDQEDFDREAGDMDADGDGFG